MFFSLLYLDSRGVGEFEEAAGSCNFFSFMGKELGAPDVESRKVLKGSIFSFFLNPVEFLLIFKCRLCYMFLC